LVLLVVFYENNKNSDFFTTFSRDDTNNLDVQTEEKPVTIESSKKRAEKGYEYVLLNDQQIEI
jgi:hypothetical protein